ncbi:MAG: hypothetical protein IJT76_04255 [Clostridia bacterium]|nr:hypothetical protein [Clostridia bacterium]
MKTHFRIIAVLAALLAALFVLASCGTSAQPSAPAQQPQNADPAPAPAESSPAESAPQEPASFADSIDNDGYEKFSQLEIGMTESDVQAILGDPVRVDKAYHYYNAKVNSRDIEIEVWINTVTGQVVYFYIPIYKNDYRDAFYSNDTDLSGVNGLENGTIKTYDDCVQAFKTSGYLTSLDDAGAADYLWVNSYSGYIQVSFRADGSVKSYNGVC